MTARKKPIRVRCDVCGETFETVDARKRRCSDTCRQRARSQRVGAPGDTKLSRAVAKELRAAKALDSVVGQVAMHLARRIEAPGATGTTAMVRELERTMDRALGREPAGAKPKPDDAPAPSEPDDDEVNRARRERDAKLSAATG